MYICIYIHLLIDGAPATGLNQMPAPNSLHPAVPSKTVALGVPDNSTEEYHGLQTIELLQSYLQNNGHTGWFVPTT